MEEVKQKTLEEAKNSVVFVSTVFNGVRANFWTRLTVKVENYFFIANTIVFCLIFRNTVRLLRIKFMTIKQNNYFLNQFYVSIFFDFRVHVAK